MSRELVGVILVGTGALFNVFGCIGLVRLPDVYNRLQAATKCVTLGTCLILAGTMALANSGMVTSKSVLCLLFVLLTSPTAAHAIARGAHASGVKLWDKSVVDKFEEDGRPGVDNGENR